MPCQRMNTAKVYHAAELHQSGCRACFPVPFSLFPKRFSAMSDHDLFDSVARKTGEDSHEIRRRGFSLTSPDDAGLEPECLLDVLLVDLPETGAVD